MHVKQVSTNVRPEVWRERESSATIHGVQNAQRRLGENLRRLRKERGLTSEELAHLAGMGTKTISRIENAHGEEGPRGRTIQKLAQALGVKPIKLTGKPLNGDDEPGTEGVLHRLGGIESRLSAIEGLLRELSEQSQSQPRPWP